VEPLVTILGLERFELGEPPLLGGDFDVEVGPGFGLELKGWVRGRDLPVTRVDLVQDAMALWQVDPSHERQGAVVRSTFYAPVSALPLPMEFDLVIRVQLGDDGGARTRLGAVHGRRAELQTGARPRINPLIVTTFSRTGSNLLLRMLAEHPEIVAYRPFRYEPRVSAYWVEVLRELTEPGSYRRQITPQLRQPARGWWLGPAGPMPAPLLDPEVEDAIARDAVHDLARFCQERIDAVYARIAPQCERPNATYFAEKHSPNEVPMILSELYPAAREVFLVRDFRDMIASMLAANERRGDVRFGRTATDTDERFVRRFRRFAANLAASWRRRSGRAHLVRYEDLLRRPHETVVALVDYLGVEATDEALAKMTESLGRREEALEGHITSASPEASIGRWRRDLAPELQSLTEEVFGTALELFGYEASGKAA
jgi:hypothetical protein